MAMDQVAFTLKESVVDDFSGGSLALGPEGQTFDIKAALDEGNGYIIVSDNEMLVTALDGIDILKRASLQTAEAAATPAPANTTGDEVPPTDPIPDTPPNATASDAATSEPVDPAKFSLDDLANLARDLNIEADGKTKAQLAAAINDAREEA